MITATDYFESLDINIGTLTQEMRYLLDSQYGYPTPNDAHVYFHSIANKLSEIYSNLYYKHRDKLRSEFIQASLNYMSEFFPDVADITAAELEIELKDFERDYDVTLKDIAPLVEKTLTKI